MSVKIQSVIGALSTLHGLHAWLWWNRGGGTVIDVISMMH